MLRIFNITPMTCPTPTGAALPSWKQPRHSDPDAEWAARLQPQTSKQIQKSTHTAAATKLTQRHQKTLNRDHHWLPEMNRQPRSSRIQCLGSVPKRTLCRQHPSPVASSWIDSYRWPKWKPLAKEKVLLRTHKRTERVLPVSGRDINSKPRTSKYFPK